MDLKIDWIESETVVHGGICGCCGRDFYGQPGSWVDSRAWPNDSYPDTFTLEDVKAFKERLVEQLAMADKILGEK